MNKLIYSLWVAVLLSLVSCQSITDELIAKSVVAADSVYLNAAVYTVDEQKMYARAVAIRDGKFVAVGGVEEVTPYVGSQTQVIDLAGKMMSTEK